VSCSRSEKITAERRRTGDSRAGTNEAAEDVTTGLWSEGGQPLPWCVVRGGSRNGECATKRSSGGLAGQRSAALSSAPSHVHQCWVQNAEQITEDVVNIAGGRSWRREKMHRQET